jgi:hypothetical protein
VSTDRDLPTQADLDWLHRELDRAFEDREIPQVVARRMWDKEIVAALDLAVRFVWFSLLASLTTLARAAGWTLRYYATLSPPTQVVLLFVALFLVAFTWGRSGW